MEMAGYDKTVTTYRGISGKIYYDVSLILIFLK